jgi:hypothetical protein
MSAPLFLIEDFKDKELSVQPISRNRRFQETGRKE